MTKKKRFRRSKFDPYITDIAKYLSMGLSTRQIAELIEHNFDDIVDDKAIYAFIRSRGLHSKVTQGGTNKHYDIPNCNECSDCIKIYNLRGNKSRLCMKKKQMIPKACRTSPIFCPERPYDNEQKQEVLRDANGKHNII